MRASGGTSSKLKGLVILCVAVFCGSAFLLWHRVGPRFGLILHSPENRFSSTASQRSVLLKWTASISPKVIGYNVYRSMASGNGYVTLNSQPVIGLSYVDTAVSSGQTYYYALTAVDGQKNESNYSEEIQVRIP